ncbi:hypothetical protein M0802_012909 [Mischocyttarus mexicanus]|nr:hypothetical protein M0802_012909 [Mischocyttarus mexicanus]
MTLAALKIYMKASNPPNSYGFLLDQSTITTTTTTTTITGYCCCYCCCYLLLHTTTNTTFYTPIFYSAIFENGIRTFCSVNLTRNLMLNELTVSTVTFVYTYQHI